MTYGKGYAMTDTTDGNEWEYLYGTSDVKSGLWLRTIENGSQELHFRFGDEGYLTISLADFLLVFRLFNAVWYSQLLKTLDICINTDCANTPYGAHVRQETCLAMSPYQKMLADVNTAQMREMHRQEALRVASLPGNDGD